MNRIKNLIFAFVLVILALDTHAEKPNIIIIYADDMGYGDCTVNNPESKIPTPNIDRLASQGLRFTVRVAAFRDGPTPQIPDATAVGDVVEVAIFRPDRAPH